MHSTEENRLEAVNRYLNLNLGLDAELQKIAETVAEISECPTALISIVDKDKQFIKFKCSFPFDQLQREVAFCNYTINEKHILVIEDATLDVRVMDNPLVTGEPHIRFYAGIPLITFDGYAIGTLCVIDDKPRTISSTMLKMIQMFGKHVINLFEFQSGLMALKQQFRDAKEDEVKLLSFFESSTSEHIIMDKDYVILAFNKRLRDFVKKEYDVDIQKGMKVTSFIRENYMQDFIDNCERALAGEHIRHERLIQFGKNFYWRDIAYDPTKDSAGEIIGISYNSSDITDRILEQNELNIHKKILEQTAFLQSHELRKPVANIKGILNLLKEDGTFQRFAKFKQLETALLKLDEDIKLIVRFTGF